MPLRNPPIYDACLNYPHPTNLMIVGTNTCGKSTLVENWLSKGIVLTDHLFWLSGSAIKEETSERYKKNFREVIKGKIVFYKFGNEFEQTFASAKEVIEQLHKTNPDDRITVVADDIMGDISTLYANFQTKSRHVNVTNILITQYIPQTEMWKNLRSQCAAFALFHIPVEASRMYSLINNIAYNPNSKSKNIRDNWLCTFYTNHVLNVDQSTYPHLYIGVKNHNVGVRCRTDSLTEQLVIQETSQGSLASNIYKAHPLDKNVNIDSEKGIKNDTLHFPFIVETVPQIEEDSENGGQNSSNTTTKSDSQEEDIRDDITIRGRSTDSYSNGRGTKRRVSVGERGNDTSSKPKQRKTSFYPGFLFVRKKHQIHSYR